MRTNRLLRHLITFFALLSACCLLAAADIKSDDSSLQDRAKVFSAAEHRELEREFAEFRRRTGVRFTVQILESASLLRLQDAGREAFDRIGFEERKKTILLIASKSPVRGDLFVGDDLREKIGPSVISFVLSHGILPRLEKQEWSAGLLSGMGILENYLTPRRGTPLAAPPEPERPISDFLLPLIILTLLFGFGVDRVLELALGNFFSALLGAVFTFGLGLTFAPDVYAGIAAFVAFTVSYLDVLGGHEEIRTAGRFKRTSAGITDYYRSRL